MNTNYILTLIGAIFILFTSCEKSEDIFDAPQQALSGNWEVMAYINDSAISEKFQIDITKDVSLTSDSIVISEKDGAFWDFSVKAAFNETKGDFGTKLSICNTADDELVGIKVANGRIIGTDSIYLELSFEDDEVPFGTTYKLKGHRIN